MTTLWDKSRLRMWHKTINVGEIDNGFSYRQVEHTVCYKIFDISSGSLFIVIMTKAEKYYTKMSRKSEFVVNNNKKYIL